MHLLFIKLLGKLSDNNEIVVCEILKKEIKKTPLILQSEWGIN